ncbi:MAG TPA: hypothetical protein VM660_02050 [Bacillus sp. (in: firmicutes)]|nr:hypothetical protein [Bacillus sp. (in: firmicutes)]
MAAPRPPGLATLIRRAALAARRRRLEDDNMSAGTVHITPFYGYTHPYGIGGSISPKYQFVLGNETGLHERPEDCPLGKFADGTSAC